MNPEVPIDQEATTAYQQASIYEIVEFNEFFVDKHGRPYGWRKLPGIPVGREVSATVGEILPLSHPIALIVSPSSGKQATIKKGTLVGSYVLPVCGRMKPTKKENRK